jgi:hypothetical protein
MSCSDQIPGCIIDPGLAQKRIGHYTDQQKKDVLSGLIGYKDEIETVDYPLGPFLELLDFITMEPGRFSGLRVYFASYLWSDTDPGSKYIPTGLEENLTLVFVPTINTPNPANPGSSVPQDDVTNIFTICFNKLQRLPNPRTAPRGQDTASNWIRHFQNKYPVLNPDGVQKAKNLNFKETRSIWYQIGMFVDNDQRIGLVSFMKCLQKDPDNPLIGVQAKMACYDHSDNQPNFQIEYQLTPVFMLHLKNPSATGDFFFGTTAFGFGEENLKGNRPFVDPPADTGLPCPPDDGCPGGDSLPSGG